MCVIISIDSFRGNPIKEVLSIVEEEIKQDEHVTSAGIGAPDLSDAWNVVLSAATSHKKHYRNEVSRCAAVVQAALLRTGLIK